MKKLLKEKREIKGITLVALVITIIVLLILAGVSIAMLTGENGILGNAEKAIAKSENAQIEENATLADYESELGEYVGGARNAAGIVESGDNSTETTEATAWYIKYSNGLIQQWGVGVYRDFQLKN